jgi:hypothetical protein
VLREFSFPIVKEERNILHIRRRINQTGLVTLRRKNLRKHVIEGRKGWEKEEEDLRSYYVTLRLREFLEYRRGNVRS